MCPTAAATESDYDAIVVGAGFSGIQTLYSLRKAGFRTRLFEAGAGLGGTWYWNRYPGARADCDSQVYQYSTESLWKDWNWSERFAGFEELLKYFRYVVDKLDLAKDIQLSTRITTAVFDNERSKWRVRTEHGGTLSARFLVLCTGTHSVPYCPAFEGMATFRGEVYHSSAWPESDVDLKGKRVAVIGTGASGVQIIQEVGPVAAHLTVYQRTPNYAMPMRQYTAADKAKWQSDRDTSEILEERLDSFTGLSKQFNFLTEELQGRAEEEIQQHFERTWEYGAFQFWLHNYKDTFSDLEANYRVYQFWRDKTRARIDDPVKQEILAPTKPPHPFGAKRPSLEQRYYEVLNQNNVDVISLRESPILRIEPAGVVTEKEGLVEIDVLILATGYDSVTGAILKIDIQNGHGTSLREKWRASTSTHLGMTTAGFPNMFFEYGPQAPNDSSNGPCSAEIQSRWITDLLLHMQERGYSKVEAKPEAEQCWRERVQEHWEKGWRRTVDVSWYQGTNVPGKPKEPLVYAGGIPSYLKALKNSAATGYQDFEFCSISKDAPSPAEAASIPADLNSAQPLST